MPLTGLQKLIQDAEAMKTDSGATMLFGSPYSHWQVIHGMLDMIIELAREIEVLQVADDMAYTRPEPH